MFWEESTGGVVCVEALEVSRGDSLTEVHSDFGDLTVSRESCKLEVAEEFMELSITSVAFWVILSSELVNKGLFFIAALVCWAGPLLKAGEPKLLSNLPLRDIMAKYISQRLKTKP